MFKDARLQERLFDQIHAVEFNMEDDFRTAEVGSILTGGFGSDSFERIADDEVEDEPIRQGSRPAEAHVSTFVDDVDSATLPSIGFQRISDDEEEGVEPRSSKRSNRRNERANLRLRQPRKSVLLKLRRRLRRRRKHRARDLRRSGPRAQKVKPKIQANGELWRLRSARRLRASRVVSLPRVVVDADDVGRARTSHRPDRPAEVDQVDTQSNGEDDEIESVQFVEPEEIVVAPPPPPAPEPSQRPRPRDQREQRDKRDQRGYRNQSRRERHQPAITDLLSEGQEILVQIAKEPIAKKGARITSHIALPGRFLVYMPTVEHVGVSRKIESDTERHRLRKLIQAIRAEEDIPSGGFIVRTAGVGISDKDLREDVRYLVRTWLDIRAAAEKSKAPALVHRDLDLVQRLLRDQLSDDFESIRVDSEEEYQAIVEFINRIQPRLVKRVKLYTKDQPILEAYGVQVEIDKAIKPRVWLKSGGYLVINQTEALVAIDVNTGKFVGRGSGRLEDTITRTNLEAVDEIVRQIRLRDLGGIIVLDLIDMEERRNRQKVMQALQEALRNDKSPTKVLSFNDFGLVIMTRKRVKQSLERTLCSPCQYCQGAGLVKSPQTICYELLEEARRLAKGINGDKDNKQVTLRINPDVAKALRTSERDVMIEIEDYLGPIDITSDQTIHQEQFDFAVT